MDVHPRVNSALAKKLWNVVRVTFLMIRKGFVSEWKLMMDLNLMMKRGKLLRKSFSNLMTNHDLHHHSSSHHMSRVGIQEYEFSCSNSPNPVCFQVHNKRKHHYFPCFNLTQVNEYEEEDDDVHYRNDGVALVQKTVEYTFNLSTESIVSTFYVRGSNYSCEDETNEGGNAQFDGEAEEFIKRFYEQLRLQSGMQLLQYDQ